jgi:hypothetical protein
MPSALKYKPLPKPSPQSDPRFKRVSDQVKQGAAKTKAHPPAAKKAADAAKAAKGPPNERLAAGKSNQVDKIKEAKEGKPEQSSFLEMLRAEIAKAMPKTLGETENFDSAADGMKGGLKGNVSQQKDKSTKDVAGTSKQAPSPAGAATPGGAVGKDAAPAAPKVDAAEGMPAPKTSEDISLQESKTDTDAQMKEAEVTPTQLQKANDPRFSAVVDAKQQVAQNADAGPAKYRGKESGVLATAASQASSKAKVSAAAMVGVRNGGNAKVLTKQQEQKAKDEAARAKVTAGIEAIFAATKMRVDEKLASIDTEVNSMFDRGTEAALAAMKRFVNGKIRDYKIRRYLSIPLVGLARWVRDQFLNLPDEVNVFYEQGRQLFQAQMDALIVRVAALVEQRLKEAKTEVAKGKQKIQEFVDSQPKELRQFAKDAQTSVASRFDELEQGIDNKKNELASSLAQKYKEGFDKANEALKEIQDSNKGFVAAFAEKLAEVIKAIMEFKAKLAAILRKGADTIKLIIADPLGFLGNLISAVKGGIAAFGANIWKHLKAGFMRWLLGNAPPGIEIPSDLTPGSVFKLVLGVLGITYDKMRAKAVKLLGPTAVTVIETLIRYVRALIEGGPAKLWEEVKGDLSNLKDMVIGAFQDYLITTIVEKAITKIVSMFNPAGAIIQAILAIVSIVQFVVEKAAQIAEFVGSVVDSIHAIATGSIGGAIKRIETALANAIPLMIGFLASLLGLSGVSKKIREFVMKVQAKVDAAIDKALAKIVAFVKKTIGKLFGKGKDKKPESPADKKERWEKGVAAVKALAAREKKKASTKGLASGLQKLKDKFQFTELRLIVRGGKAVIDAAMSPGTEIPVDDTEFVTAEDGVTIIIPKKDPAVTVGLAPSNDGNNRLFGFDAKGIKIMVYVVSKKAWQAVPSDERVREMEQKAREWLAAHKDEFASLVNASKHPSAPGFDIAGLGKEPGGTQERLFIGEAKGSFQGSPMWFQAAKFTAIQGTPLTKNVAGSGTANPTAVSRINTALASGNVTIVIFLNKDAYVSDKAWATLERNVRRDLKAYILTNFPDRADDIKKIMKNVQVTHQRI